MRPVHQSQTTTQELTPVPPEPGPGGLRRGRWLLVAGLALVLVAVGFVVLRLNSGDSHPTSTSGNTSLTPSAGTSGQPTNAASPSTSASASASASASPSAGKSTSPKPAAPAGPPAQSGYPGPSNTGVPAGTKLTTYSGSCNITADNTVIDSKTVNCASSGLTIHAKNVTIKRSKVNGLVGTSETTPYSFTLEDSEVDAGFGQYAAVGTTNMTILRANIHGGVTSVYCYSNCSIKDSYLHGQRLDPTAPWHLGAFLANDNGNDPGGRTNANLQHNTIICDAVPNPNDGGCSGDINLYGDFGPITYVTVNNNYLGANTGISYCVYGGESSTKPYPHADHVVITNNVFQRGTNGGCGAYGPVTGFDTGRPGNVWSNNVWSDGKAVTPEN